ncbi:MAG: sigma-70 family RNA polymerase sigma factor [Tepidisphaeraceae bacterium]|jgi:RNA polymerase sigma-70 factor (ECF subfamily)
MEPSPDDPLLLRLARGCPRSFAELYDRFGGPLYRAARTMLRSSADAEDAVQDVFVSLVRGRERLGEVDNLPAYLFTSLRHVASQRLTRRDRERQAMRLLSEVSRDACAGPAARTDEQIERALSDLPDEQREVLALKIDGGLTFAEIGSVLDVSLNTAASRYRYALEKLRLTMGGEQP